MPESVAARPCSAITSGYCSLPVMKTSYMLDVPCLHSSFIVSLQGDLLHVLSHPERPLRHTAGSIITTIVGSQGLAVWPELVMSLGHGMGSSDASTLDGALDTLAKVVEDHPQQVCFLSILTNLPAACGAYSSSKAMLHIQPCPSPFGSLSISADVHAWLLTVAVFPCRWM